MGVHSRVFERLLSFAVYATCFPGLVNASCSRYEVRASFKCTEVTGGVCLAWEQLGYVEQPACFPGNAWVLARYGPVALSDLRLGDEILGFDPESNATHFSSVRAWLHRDPNTTVSMINLSTAVGSLISSPRHALAVAGGMYSFASDFRPGQDFLTALNGTEILVDNVSRVKGHGLYSPLTWLSNYYVMGPSMDRAVLAHCFSELQVPTRYQHAWHALLSIAEWMFPSLRSGVAEDEGGAYMHPLAGLMLSGSVPWLISIVEERGNRIYNMFAGSREENEVYISRGTYDDATK